MKLKSFTILILLFSLSGCNSDFLPKPREISDLQLVQVIGVDLNEEVPGQIKLSIASKNMEVSTWQDSSGSEGGANGNVKKALVQTATGVTVFEAVRNMQTHGNKTLFWSHTQYYLIGEEAAKDNLIRYLDFFTRDHELRIEAKVLIVKGSTAKELIEQVNLSDFFIVDILESLERNVELLSISEEMKISELIRFVDIHHSSARVPCIELVHRSSESGISEPDIEPCGYAIIKDLKLAGYIDKSISRGINLITNQIKSSIVNVADLSGGKVSLEIIQSKTEVIPYFSGDTLKEIQIRTRVKNALGEVQSIRSVVNEKEIRFMETQQSEILKMEMEKALKATLSYSSDCLNICDRIRMKRPLKWKKIEDDWMEIMENVKYSIVVESEIERSYQLNDPSGYEVNE